MAPGAPDKKAGLKQKLSRELQRFVVVFLYMAVMIGAFTTYRLLLMEEYHLGYFAYGYALIQALVLAKIIMVGETLGLGERFADRPLIVPTFYKSLLFALLVLVFSILEHFLKGFLDGKELAGVIKELFSIGGYEILARILVMFVAFLPFFAFGEAEQALQEIKLFEMFFRKRS